MPRLGVDGIASIGVCGRGPVADGGIPLPSGCDSRRLCDGLVAGVVALIARSIYVESGLGCRTTVDILAFLMPLLPFCASVGWPGAGMFSLSFSSAAFALYSSAGFSGAATVFVSVARLSFG